MKGPPIDTQTPSFGTYLREIRLEKGVSLETISNATNIRLENLILIEKEDHARLPAEVFVKGFLRAYTAAIGGEIEETLRRYTLSRAAWQQTEHRRVPLLDRLRIKGGAWLKLVMLLAIGGGLAFMMTLFVQNDRPPRNAEPQTENSEVSSLPVAQGGNSSRQSSELTAEPDTDDSALRLAVLAHRKTWLKIIWDNEAPRTYRLNKGEQLELDAVHGFNILAQSPESVRLTLNGQAVHVLGKSGEMVNIQVP